MAELPEELIPTRATLLLRLKDLQDHSSWQDFFDTYWNLIYGVAVKKGLTPAEAEDVVQETMITVARQMPGFRYDPALGSFKGWLLTVTRWRIADQFRKRGRGELVLEDGVDGLSLEEAGSDSPDLEKLWDAEWEDNLLKAAWGRARRQIDPQQFQIFDFYVNKEWPPEKVAKLLSVSIGQVYLAKHRVTNLVRDEVERLKKEVV